MTNQIRYLNVDEILVIHRRMVEEFGGTDGVADDDIYRTIPAKAAVLLFSLCKNHPFLDGNKRVAAASCETFLLLKGYELNVNNDRFGDLVIAVADGSLDRDALIQQFGTVAVPRQ